MHAAILFSYLRFDKSSPRDLNPGSRTKSKTKSRARYPLHQILLAGKRKRYIYVNKRSLGGQDSPSWFSSASWFLISGSKPACWTYICKKGIVYNTDGHEVFTEMRLVGMLHAGYLDCITWEKSNPLTVYCSKFVNLCVPGWIRTQDYIHVKLLDPVPYPLHHRIHSTWHAFLHLHILITGYSVYCTSFNSYW